MIVLPVVGLGAAVGRIVPARRAKLKEIRIP
jgi:hypothetical protein